MTDPPWRACGGRLRGRRGVTLVELCIVVAITGILAAIAVSRFRVMQLKAKRAELPTNVNGIKQALLAYDASFDGYIELSLAPRDDSALDKNTVPWDSSLGGWHELGWAPDGEVRGNYQAGLSQVDHPGEPFLITARCDVDDDDALTEYTAKEGTNAEITPSRDYLY